MEFDQSSLYREAMDIINDGSKPVSYVWTAEIHVGDKTYNPLKLLSIDFLEDYELNISDVVMLKLAIPGGVYAKRIDPFKTNLEITLYRYPLQETGDTADEEIEIESERYTAILVDMGNPLMESNGPNVMSEQALDLTNIFEVDFQLINKSLEQVRMISVGGNYRSTTVQDVITGVLTTECQKVKVADDRSIKGVTMVTADNDEPRDHIILPHGLKLHSVPEYIHFNCGGVYNSGLGYYLKGDYWYIYPCYDVTRFNDTPNTMTIINVPRNRFPQIERTYRQDGTNLTILATGEVSFNDDTEIQQLNLGNGVRFADADRFMEGFGTTKGNKTLIQRGKNVSEFISVERPNGNNLVSMSNQAINANPFVEYSKLARRQGRFLNMVWENALPTLIEPGTPVKMLYLADDEIQEIYGVMLKAHHYVQMKGIGVTDGRHITQTVLSIFVQKESEAKEEEE